MDAESPMTSSDLSISVSSMQKQITIRVVLLDTIEVSNGEAARRMESLSSAVRPVNAMDMVMLVHETSDVKAGLQSIMRLQNLYDPPVIVEGHSLTVAGFLTRPPWCRSQYLQQTRLYPLWRTSSQE